MLFQHYRPSHRSILSHQTWHCSRHWTEIPKPKEELLELLAWRAQEIGRHSQLIWWQLQQRLSELSGTSAGSSFHRELESQRIERDENDVNNIIQCIETKLVNPFDISQYEGEKMLLIEIATGTVVHLNFRNLYSVLRSKAKKQWDSLSEPG